MLIKNKNIKSVVGLLTVFILLLSQNSQASSWNIRDNCGFNMNDLLSPQLMVAHEVFMQDYQKIAKTRRWLKPDIVGFFGGTGGNIAGNILSFSDLNKFLTKKLFVSFIISPHDDGGSSAKQQKMLYEYLGYTFSPGDTNNIFSGLTSYFKKRVLRTRFPKNISGSFLRDELQKIIDITEGLANPRQLFVNEKDKISVDKLRVEGVEYQVRFDKENGVFVFGDDKRVAIGHKIVLKNEEFIITECDGKTMLCFIPGQENAEPLKNGLISDLNWQNFKEKTLALAEVFDREFINPKTKTLPGENIDISEGSMGNFLIAAKMIQCGAYDPKRKGLIDQDKYHQGIQELCDLLDIDNGFVSFSTFDPATLCVKLASIAIEKGNNTLLLEENNAEALRGSGIKINKIDRSRGIFEINCQDSDNDKYTEFNLKISEYIEGYVYRNKSGYSDSCSEISIPLDVFKQYPVAVSHDGLQIQIKIIDGKIVELQYEKEQKVRKIRGEQLKQVESNGQISFAFPDEIGSMSDEKLRGLPRFYIDKQSAQLHIVLDTKGQGVGLSINDVQLKIIGRLIIEQTNITESLHHCGIVDFGFLNNARPRVNKDCLLAIENAPLLIMGPGSQYTSLMSILLIPEIVEALRRRVSSGKENLFIFNAVRDNETVDSRSVSNIIHDVERTTGVRFGEIFNNAVVNDIESLMADYFKAKDYFSSVGESSPYYLEAKELFEEYTQILSLMNEMKDKNSSGKRSVFSFSRQAKYSRGNISFDKNDLSELIAQDVEVYKTKVILSTREVRKEGQAGKEVSIRYDNAHIANIIDQIFWKRGALFNQDERLSKLRRKLIAEYFNNDEDEFDKAIERIRGEGILKSKSPAEAARYVFERLEKDDFVFSQQQRKLLLEKKVIITNLKHTLCAKNEITPKIREQLEVFLRRGGKLIVISGFEFQDIRKRLLDFVDKSVWGSIILVSNYGTDAWYWDEQQGKHISLFTSFYEEAEISQMQRDKWRQIIDNTVMEYGLNKPLKGNIRYSDETIAEVEDRGTMIALCLGQRRYLYSLNMITMENYRLQEQSLPLIADDGILRTPMIERLNNMFAKYDLPITAVLGGTGTINTMVKKAANKGDVIQRVFWSAKDKGLLPKQSLEKKLLIMGKGNYEIARKLESDQVPWAVFQIPRQSTRYMIEFQKKYGVPAAELFLEQLNFMQSSFEAGELSIKSQNQFQDNFNFITQAI